MTGPRKQFSIYALRTENTTGIWLQSSTYVLMSAENTQFVE